MPESVTIHIGPVKTGTTSIQFALAAAASDLRAHGVYYEVDPAWGPGTSPPSSICFGWVLPPT